MGGQLKTCLPSQSKSRESWVRLGGPVGDGVQRFRIGSIRKEDDRGWLRRCRIGSIHEGDGWARRGGADRVLGSIRAWAIVGPECRQRGRGLRPVVRIQTGDGGG